MDVGCGDGMKYDEVQGFFRRLAMTGTCGLSCFILTLMEILSWVLRNLDQLSASEWDDLRYWKFEGTGWPAFGALGATVEELNHIWRAILPLYFGSSDSHDK
jgi:hypothetical protein